MASTGSRQLKLYGRGLQQFSQRLYSTQQPQSQGLTILIDPNRSATAKHKSGPNASLFFSPNPKFPLPGNVTFVESLQPKKEPKPDISEPRSSLEETDVLSATSNYERQLFSMDNFGRVSEKLDAPTKFNKPDNCGDLECVAKECPKLLKNEFKDLFLNHDMNTGDLTVLTLSQKTENDMSAWSQEMEVERDALTSQFIEAASQVCSLLKEAGYWADFIDPSSGRPYLGPFTNATLFETDERYKKLGFQVEDLGCCKVIKHILWGTNAFIGTIFTDAPFGDPAVKHVLSQVNGP
jgi:hypothetical protein